MDGDYILELLNKFSAKSANPLEGCFWAFVRRSKIHSNKVNNWAQATCYGHSLASYLSRLVFRVSVTVYSTILDKTSAVCNTRSFASQGADAMAIVSNSCVPFFIDSFHPFLPRSVGVERKACVRRARPSKLWLRHLDGFADWLALAELSNLDVVRHCSEGQRQVWVLGVLGTAGSGSAADHARTLSVRAADTTLLRFCLEREYLFVLLTWREPSDTIGLHIVLPPQQFGRSITSSFGIPRRQFSDTQSTRGSIERNIPTTKGSASFSCGR